MRMTARRERPPVDLVVAPGERVLAWCEVEDGTVLAGTRDAVYLVAPEPARDTVRVPWEQVEAADWDLETSTFRLSEVGQWGQPRPVHVLVLPDPRRVLELVRERVTASIVLQRHVPLGRGRWVRVIARRAATGARELSWFVEYDEGTDPSDPGVQEAARTAIAAARNEVGHS
ncbi:hypothetical protein [Nocardioides houyundeii]|uniref:hypothetical protein n=1 Tax=Nocardioides houyundeii TaxID=2045452 RepID=UPI0013B390B4|nr:hypothetical protein [Nocardioides houyundeii]